MTTDFNSMAPPVRLADGRLVPMALEERADAFRAERGEDGVWVVVINFPEATDDR